MPSMPFSLDSIVHWLLTHGVKIGLILLGAFIAYRIVKAMVRKFEKKVRTEEAVVPTELEKRAKTLARIVQTALIGVIMVIALMMIIKELGLDIGPIIAGAGIIGLAIGFGAQSLVKDVISGFFILMEDQYRVGDVVEVAGIGGLVEQMSLRVTILRDLEGKVHFIPNGSINTATNMTKEWSRTVLDIGVAYKEDPDKVMNVLREVGDEMKKDPAYSGVILEPLQILGVSDFADSAVIIKVMFKTLPLKQWDVGREFRRRVKIAFDEKGIEIPFPHVTLYMGEAENKGKLVVETKTTSG
jgi:small-conductance mechanosensitive channel